MEFPKNTLIHKGPILAVVSAEPSFNRQNKIRLSIQLYVKLGLLNTLLSTQTANIGSSSYRELGVLQKLLRSLQHLGSFRSSTWYFRRSMRKLIKHHTPHPQVQSKRLVSYVGCPVCFNLVKPFVVEQKQNSIVLSCPITECQHRWEMTFKELRGDM